MAKKVKARALGHQDASRLSKDELRAIRRRAARKAGVPVEALVGPFDGTTTPEKLAAAAGQEVPPGMYVGISNRTGQAVWRWRGAGYWGRYATSLHRAHEKKARATRATGMIWFGCDPAKVPAKVPAAKP